MAGLDWKVIQVPITTEDGMEINGYKANLRDSDCSVLGVVTDRYKVVQNSEAFAFTDALLGEGVRNGKCKSHLRYGATTLCSELYR